jgi:hypothetical protein
VYVEFRVAKLVRIVLLDDSRNGCENPKRQNSDER